jgi:hypothetical protein
MTSGPNTTIPGIRQVQLSGRYARDTFNSIINMNLVGRGAERCTEQAVEEGLGGIEHAI